MAVTVTAVLVDDASTWATEENKKVPGHAGWNNSAGDRDWIPDTTYYRRVRLEATGPEVGGIVNWEVFDTTEIPFVDDVAAYVPTPGSEPIFVNDEKTRKVWAWNGTEYVNTGSGWVSVLRANGPRAIVELPAYFKWAATEVESASYDIRAYLPGSFGKESGKATLTIKNPLISVLGV